MKYLCRLFTKICTFFLLLLCLLTTFSFAANSYNANAALAYAKANWNKNSNQLCAEFVKNCLKAGGCNATNSNGCTTMVRQLRASGLGTWNQLAFESDGRISIAKNKGLLSVGDPVFYYCPHETDGCPYVHVVLYSGQDSNGYLKAYAHNSARNNETIRMAYCGYCGGKISAAYTYHLNGSSVEENSGSATKPQYFNCKVQISCTNGKQ